MFVPLVDTLRCTRLHEETWLVASIERAEDRDIIEGTLGCPTCLAEYPIRRGVVYFAKDVARIANSVPSERDAVRLAAGLDLTDARMTAVLHGAWGAHSPIMRGLTPARLLLLNPPADVMSGDGISIVCAESAPFARGAVNAVAFDRTASASMIVALSASLRGGGRMFGPASVPVPPGLTELARDTDVWVARLESSAVTSAPILPTRRSR